MVSYQKRIKQHYFSLPPPSKRTLWEVGWSCKIQEWIQIPKEVRLACQRQTFVSTFLRSRLSIFSQFSQIFHLKTKKVEQSCKTSILDWQNLLFGTCNFKKWNIGSVPSIYTEILGQSYHSIIEVLQNCSTFFVSFSCERKSGRIERK